MDKRIEEFESWFLKHKEKEQFEADLSKTNGLYNYTRTLNLWVGWKASRENMKAIKFPDAIKSDNRLLGDNDYCAGYNQALRDCEKQSISVGYKVE